MVLLTCLVIDPGCISGPNGCPSGMRNWASAQHEASQSCKIAKAEAASSLKIYVLKFTQYHFCHILLVKASHKASSVSSGGKLDSFCWWEEQQNHISENVKNCKIFAITRWQQSSKPQGSGLAFPLPPKDAEWDCLLKPLPTLSMGFWFIEMTEQ